MTSTLKTNAIEPEGGTTNLVIGESGQNTVISNNDIRANVFQDAGGNAIFTSDGSGNVTGVNSGIGAPKVLLSTTTVSSAVANISFTSGITSTYKEYIFYFINMNPATDSVDFTFQGNAVGASGYNEIITSTYFRAFRAPSGTDRGLAYLGTGDQNEGTAYQKLARELGNVADESMSGELHLFNPASTTYVKNFYATISLNRQDNYAMNLFVAGYFNITLAVDDIQFKMSSGNINGGKIKMYGVK